MLSPFIAANRINDVDIDGLLAADIRGLAIDLDNTLMLPQAAANHGAVPKDIRVWLDEANAAGLKLICVTNNKDIPYCHQAEKTLGFPLIAQAHKPFGMGLRYAINQLGEPPKQIAVIGDRPTTDGWGAFAHGCRYIQTAPLRQDEPGLYTVLRQLEKLCVGRPLLDLS